MFKSRNIKKWLSIAALTVSVLVIAGCGDDSAAGSKENSDVKVVQVATRGTSKPFTYVDEKGNLTGYDVELLKEVERRDPSLHFEFKTMSVDAAFVAIDAGQVDMIANQMRNNPQRAAKYNYTKEINNYTVRKIVVKNDRNDINSLDDLQGKTVAATTNSEFSELLKEYNKTAATPINIVYSEKGPAETVNLAATGRVDAAAEYEYLIHAFVKDQGLPLKVVGKTIQSVPTFFLVKKDPEFQKVADKIDVQMKAMREDGTLKKISEQYLGGDYTNKPAD